MFKPNLIPNSKVSKPIDLYQVIQNLIDWVISFKKDGCRMELMTSLVLGRSLEPIASNQIQSRYKKLAEQCERLNIVLEGEFYAHGFRFEEIKRFFKTTDVTDPKNLKKLKDDEFRFNLTGTVKKPKWIKVKTREEKEAYESEGHVCKFDQDWPGRTPEWMSTWHPELKMWTFDVYFADYPEYTFEQRILWLRSAFKPGGVLHEFSDLVELGDWYNLDNENLKIETHEQREWLYNWALENDYEGLVLTNKHKPYRLDRATPKEGVVYKMKEDKLEWDGKVIDIIEGTVAREGAAKTTNALGRSVTSKLAEDRRPSGIASGILSEYDGHSIKVSFEGYSHDELREILANKELYIGKWFKYKGMRPTKNVPRHAHMNRNSWRDEK